MESPVKCEEIPSYIKFSSEIVENILDRYNYEEQNEFFNHMRKRIIESRVGDVETLEKQLSEAKDMLAVIS